ncbi:MAG: hypothetical protein ACD_72C00065G0002 [uncultured bacterium]|uniref:Uncharacterized protein n=1 Tax=Candidatus Magasanikbacteria bacterium RIFOXYD2_FULL_36_9 TaxID=1798707 RepID=A0A1F6P1D4_9BACT|nr:MAG: hypothetical protein ACD_72C00065G0002 [uncultured bacterium]OGH89979.1 MAG: hypothetical protein A2537_02555 [Candidatus Magasanikbacteria bacterium RIFOXYD2_FULL_36_9]
MGIFKSQFIFTKQAANALEADVVQQFASYTKDWHLYNWEDGLLFQIFPVVSSLKLSLVDLEDVAEIVKIMRGENKEFVQFSVDEVSGLNINGLYNDDLNIKRLIRTIYYCLNNNDVDLAIATRESLDKIFAEKKDGSVSYSSFAFLLRIYLCLFSYYFRHVPDELSHFIFANSYVVVLIQMGFDLEKIIMDYNSTLIVFNNRMNFCLELAASLSENESFIGVDVNGQPKTIKYWIDNFRVYSKKSFDGTSLLNFTSDKNYFGRCTATDKEIIIQIFQLYTHLINGFLAVPGGDLNVVNVWAQNLEKNNFSDDIFGYFKITENMNKNKPVEYSKSLKMDNIVEYDNNTIIDANAVHLIVSSEFGYFLDDQYPDVDLVLKRLAELAVTFNNPKILEMYYFDDQENKFKWSI